VGHARKLALVVQNKDDDADREYQLNRRHLNEDSQRIHCTRHVNRKQDDLKND